MESENPAVSMRAPECWLVALRIAIGAWFAKALFTKLGIVFVAGFIPLPGASERWLRVMPMLLTKYTDGNPHEFYKNFVVNTVVPHTQLFAHLTAVGEVVVGLGLVLGCLTVLSSGIGLVLIMNYYLLVGWQGASQQGFHYALAVCLIVILGARAGRLWGVDGWVRRRHPGSLLARLPVG
jgi:uncharacterized membrane protein YphA (DoxX/SURF4 family)